LKICIVKLSAMGDIIHAMVALEFIKKRYNDVCIDWVVEDGFKTILYNNPHIDNIISINLKSLKKDKSKIFTQYKLIKSISKNNYDVIVDAQGLIKSAIVSKLIGANQLIGFDKNSIRESVASIFYTKQISIGYEKNAIDRNMMVLCSSLDIPYTKEDILNKKPFLYYKSNIFKTLDYEVVFVVGASRENKIYPKESFVKLANLLEKKVLVVWGNDDEFQNATYIAKYATNTQIAPKGDLDDLKSIIANAKLVVGGDTGPTHIAWGANTPSITIFGNTPEYRNSYITPINKVVKSNSKVDPLKLNHNDFSIKEIQPKEIIKVIQTIKGLEL